MKQIRLISREDRLKNNSIIFNYDNPTFVCDRIDIIIENINKCNNDNKRLKALNSFLLIHYASLEKLLKKYISKK